MMQNVFRIYTEEIPAQTVVADPFGDLYMALHPNVVVERHSSSQLQA